jgi:hypothetical protein
VFKGLSKKRVFDLVEFKNATKIERMYMYMIEPDRFVLAEDEERYFHILRQSYAVIAEFDRPRGEVIEAINTIKGDFRASAYKIIKDAQALYGMFEEIDKRVQRAIVREKLKMLAMKAQEQNDGQLEARCYEAMIRLDKLDQADGDPVQDITIPMLEITSDPTALIEEAEIFEDGETEEAETISES